MTVEDPRADLLTVEDALIECGVRSFFVMQQFERQSATACNDLRWRLAQANVYEAAFTGVDPNRK